MAHVRGAVGFFVCNANRGDNGDTVSLSNAHRDSLGGNAGLCPRTTQTNETRVTTRRDIASTDNAAKAKTRIDRKPYTGSRLRLPSGCAGSLVLGAPRHLSESS